MASRVATLPIVPGKKNSEIDCVCAMPKAEVSVPNMLALAARFGDLRFDAVDFVANIHAARDRTFVGVFSDEILIEETNGLLGRRGGEADEVGVEVFEHLPPEAVDGTMTFIGDDEIKHLDGDGGIVGDFLWATIRCADLVGGHFVSVLGQFLTAQHRVKPLNGADGHAADVIELVRGEMLDVVKLGEFAPGVGRDELIKLAFGLASKIGAVHQKKNAPGFRMTDQAIGESAGGIGLPAPVAIWISARGRSSAKDFSRSVMASI